MAKAATSYEAPHLVAQGSMTASEQLHVMASLTASQFVAMKKAIRMLCSIGMAFDYATELILIGCRNRQIEMANMKSSRTEKY